MSTVATLCIESLSVEDTERLAQSLARHVSRHPSPFVIHLQGELGAGKTTLARAVLRALGVEGAIKSPTYSLLEPYQTAEGLRVHVDLYRVRDAAEVDCLALRDYLEPASVWLIEWPERALDAIPQPDLALRFEFEVQHRVIELQAKSPRGLEVVAAMRREWGSDKR